MKQKKRLFLTLLLCLTGILTLNARAFAQTDQTEEVTLILHKRLFKDSAATDTRYPNDGLMLEADSPGLIADTVPLNGASFEVYDASDYYQGAGKSPEVLVKAFSQMTLTEARDFAAEHQMTRLTTITTAHDPALAQDGIARITLPKTVNHKPAAYLLIETGAETAVDLEQAIPLLVVLPVLDPVDARELDEIHLYPKNTALRRSVYFYKYGRTTEATDIPLADVKFSFYQRGTGGEKRYLAAGATLEWRASQQPLEDEGVVKFTSDATGLVNLTGYNFPAGTYYFQELQTAAGFVIDKEHAAIKVEIPQERGHITIAGQKIPETGREEGFPRIINQQEDTTEDTGKLPSTNEAQTLIFLLGLLLMTIGFVGMKKRKKNQEETK